MITILAIVIGIVVGCIMGLTGAGGGILAVPALVYSQGWSMQEAMPVALLAVSLSALIGTIEGFSKKLVRYKAALLMAAAGAPLTLLGVQIAGHLSQMWLMLIFSLMLFWVAGKLVWRLRAQEFDVPTRDTLAHINAHTGKFDWSFKAATVIASIGAAAGFVTGLLGVGGGFIIVPLLRAFTNVTMHGAVATSLMVISLVGSFGVVSSVSHGAVLPPMFTALFAAASVAGMLLGRQLAKKFSAKKVHIIFTVLLFAVAMSLLFKALA